MSTRPLDDISDIKSEECKLIEYMLEEVETHFEDRKQTNEFIESIREQYDNRGWLSAKQIEALRRFYENI